jgi:GalNAc-alpha-(1->4)-GalNAc-alpha-(1->3)-diNAcBac-PP-undecaprenol alpha-1,4-N-acetyl-D-galactosaminyltransferase
MHLNNKKRKILFYAPAITSGGAERVLSVLANYLSNKGDIEVIFVISSQDEPFYELDSKIKIVKPAFNYKNSNRFIFTLKIFFFLRNSIKKYNPDSAICFQGRFNAFFLLAALGLNIKTIISDRSRPGISYGKVLDVLNKLIYPIADGYIAQTEVAAQIAKSNFNPKNIIVLPNPIHVPDVLEVNKEKVILNVGRFIKTKNQFELLKIFLNLNRTDFKLVFLGDGAGLDACKSLLSNMNIDENRVQFLGNIKNVTNYYNQSIIFAFTSTSEGFPNALAEAMASGCACISYDCLAGPSDLIENGKTGFLIKEGDTLIYQKKLEEMMDNFELSVKMGNNGFEKVKSLKEDVICNRFLEFLDQINQK